MNAQQLLAKIKQYPVAVGGGLVGVVFLGLLYFTSGSASELEARYNDVEGQLDVILQNETSAIGLEEDVEQAEKLVTEIESRLMVDEATADHYVYFLGLAESTNVLIDDPVYSGYYNPDEKGVNLDTKEFAQIEYAIKVEGPFESVLDFLYTLKTGKYFVRVTNLVLEQSTEIENNGVMAEITARVLAVKKEVEKEDE